MANHKKVKAIKKEIWLVSNEGKINRRIYF